MIGTLADPRRGEGDRHDRRHGRPRLVPARAGPAPQGALQQARRLRLRAVRRSRDQGAHRGHAGPVPRLRGDARRHERQPPRRPGHRREDRGEAHQHLRRPRGDLRAPRRPPAEAAGEPRRDARPRVPEPRDDAAPARLRHRPRSRRPRPARVRPGGGADALQPARVPHAVPPAARSGRHRGVGGDRTRLRGRRRRRRPRAHRRRGAVALFDAIAHRRADATRSSRDGPGSPVAPTSSGLGVADAATASRRTSTASCSTTTRFATR